jgi:hypothetical protein
MNDAIQHVPRKFVGDVFAWADEVTARLVAEGVVPKAHALLMLTALREDMRGRDALFADQLVPKLTEAVGVDPEAAKFEPEGNAS